MTTAILRVLACHVHMVILRLPRLLRHELFTWHAKQHMLQVALKWERSTNNKRCNNSLQASIACRLRSLLQKRVVPPPERSWQPSLRHTPSIAHGFASALRSIASVAFMQGT